MLETASILDLSIGVLTAWVALQWYEAKRKCDRYEDRDYQSYSLRKDTIDGAVTDSINDNATQSTVRP
jgi:hypothetical protein